MGSILLIPLFTISGLLESSSFVACLKILKLVLKTSVGNEKNTPHKHWKILN